MITRREKKVGPILAKDRVLVFTGKESIADILGIKRDANGRCLVRFVEREFDYDA